MPPVVAAAASFFTTYVLGTAIGRAVLGLGLNWVSSKLLREERPEAPTLGNVQYTVRSAVEHHKVVYGQAMLSGPVAYANIGGTVNTELWTDIALTGHEVDSFVSIWLDGNEIPVADIDWTPATTGSPFPDGTGSGKVSTAKFLTTDSPNASAVFIRYYLGHSEQVAPSAMVSEFSDIDSNYRLAGRAHFVTTIVYKEHTEGVWEEGMPSDYKAVVKGKKVYDPRLDSTNGGSGTHRYTDSSTWEWSENPALCVADYLVSYMGAAAATDIDWTALATAADACDVLVPVPPAASPENTETRFTCNGVLSLGATHKDNLDQLLSSMAGTLAWANGKYVVRASVWEASSVSITEDDFIMQGVQGSAPRSERFNTIRGIFLDPSRDYVTADFPRVSDSGYVTRDNGESLSRDLELPMTNSPTMCQRIGFRFLDQGNNQIVARLKLNHKGAQIQIGDVVSITHVKLGWVAKTFRCIQWVANSDDTYDITFKEDSSASYDDPIVADYSTGVANTVTVPAPTIPPPTNLTATTVERGVRLDWTNPALRAYKYIEVWVSYDNNRSNATKIAETSSNRYLDVVSDVSRLRYYWIRAIGFAGSFSTYEPDSSTTTAAAYPEIQTSPLIADPMIRLGSSYWSFGNNASYRDTSPKSGTDSTDVLAFTPSIGVNGYAFGAARRGPEIWDPVVNGPMTVFVRWRDCLGSTSNPPSPVTAAPISQPFPIVKVTNEDQSSPQYYVASRYNSYTYTGTETIGQWYEHSASVVINDTGTAPRYMQVGLKSAADTGQWDFYVDYLDAVIVFPNEVVKTATIESPTASEDLTLLYTDQPIVIKSIRAVLSPDASPLPSITYKLVHDTNRSATGTDIFTSRTVTSTTTGDSVSEISDPTVPANSFIWLETSAKTGTIDEMQIFIQYSESAAGSGSI